MSIRTLLVVCLAATGINAASAQENSPPPPAFGPEDGGYELLRETIVELEPQLGAIFFNSADEESAVKPAAGFTLVYNPLAHADIDTNRRVLGGRGYLALGSGLFYAPLSGDADFGYIPVNLLFGGLFSDRFRVALHAGVNITWLSDPSAMNLRQEEQPEERWGAYPNAGFNIDFAAFEGLALGARFDWLFTPADDMITGTVGVTLPLVSGN